MKRKADSEVEGKKPTKRRSKEALSDEEAKARFRKDLFDKDVLDGFTSQHHKSTPYQHCVISDLIDDALLRNVRTEIKANVSFTPKETDIYRIHQSGDLANLDGLDDDALAKLPSLLQLRDAMYSQTFRDYVSHITGCGPLSGRKTDMAINVYTPGCYLLCHDDVIGSRRISYILYLVDPDVPWQAEWGGALRLYPVTKRLGSGGDVAKAVEPDVVKTIPPAWNQLALFAVQPGVSFHDVEEVYHAPSAADLIKDGGRVRMAISGWFHIPQIGEPGWVRGAEEENERNSGLMQLQGYPAQHDRPNTDPVPLERSVSDLAEDLDAAGLEFLLKYISPFYLNPDTLDRMVEYFEDKSFMTLPGILAPKFAEKLKTYLEEQEKKPLPASSEEIERAGPWKVARPPHKHRFLYQEPGATDAEESPLKDLLENLLPSTPFKLWLQFATRSVIEARHVHARRFRRGEDYTLATGYEGKPRLELNLGITPTLGWGEAQDGDGGEEADKKIEDEVETDKENEDEEDEGAPVKEEVAPVKHEAAPVKGEEAASVKGEVAAPVEDEGASGKTNGQSTGVTSETKGKGTDAAEDAEGGLAEGEPAKDEPAKEELVNGQNEDNLGDVGGQEVYMAGDDDDGTEDAAIYKTGGDEDDVLFFQAASWNKMTVVLRDRGTLRFVKYVSRNAKGDRWDVSGTFDIDEPGDEPQEVQVIGVVDDTEEEFKGFSASEDSDSDW